jgi:hypothetical protein
MKLDLKSIHFLTQYNFVGDPMQVQIQAPNPALLFPILVHILHYQQGVVGCLSLWCTQQNNKKKKLHFKKPAEGAQPFFYPKPGHILLNHPVPMQGHKWPHVFDHIVYP